MDKKLKWVIIIGSIAILAVPSSILTTYYILNNLPHNDVNEMIDHSGTINFSPTPESDIDLAYSIKEILNLSQYIYQFNFTFDVLEGVESIYTYDELIFNDTRLYTSIKANHGLDFYSIFFLMNMTEYQIGNSQFNYYKELETSHRFENLEIQLQRESISNGDEGVIHLYGGSVSLFTKEQVITTENIENFTGKWYIWINENNYNLSYEIFPDLSLHYMLNSSIDDSGLYYGYISIIGIDGTHAWGIGSINFPSSPQGYQSQSSTTNLTQSYESMKFRVEASSGWFAAAEIKYEIVSLSKILEEQAVLEEEQRKNLWKAVFNYTLLTVLGVAIILGCMIQSPQKPS